jgi:hypothetical protein
LCPVVSRLAVASAIRIMAMAKKPIRIPISDLIWFLIGVAFRLVGVGSPCLSAGAYRLELRLTPIASPASAVEAGRA